MALRALASGRGSDEGKYNSPALVLSRSENAYFIGEKAAGTRILFC